MGRTEMFFQEIDMQAVLANLDRLTEETLWLLIGMSADILVERDSTEWTARKIANMSENRKWSK